MPRSREEVLTAVMPLVERHGHAFHDLYASYATGGAHTHPEGRQRMTEAGFLELAKDYRLCQGLLTRVQLQTIARPEWDVQYPGVDHKLQLLLFWMDQASALFRGNGHDLLAQLITHPRNHAAGGKRAGCASMASSLAPHVVAPLRDIFARYCNFGARLNCGPGASMSRLQLRRLLHDANVFDPPHVDHSQAICCFTDADFDIVFSNFMAANGAKAVRISFEQFVQILGQVAAKKFPRQEHESLGSPLDQLLGQHILPAAARTALEKPVPRSFQGGSGACDGSTERGCGGMDGTRDVDIRGEEGGDDEDSSVEQDEEGSVEVVGEKPGDPGGIGHVSAQPDHHVRLPQWDYWDSRKSVQAGLALKEADLPLAAAAFGVETCDSHGNNGGSEDGGDDADAGRGKLGDGGGDLHGGSTAGRGTMMPQQPSSSHQRPTQGLYTDDRSGLCSPVLSLVSPPSTRPSSSLLHAPPAAGAMETHLLSFGCSSGTQLLPHHTALYNTPASTKVKPPPPTKPTRPLDGHGAQVGSDSTECGGGGAGQSAGGSGSGESSGGGGGDGASAYHGRLHPAPLHAPSHAFAHIPPADLPTAANAGAASPRVTPQSSHIGTRSRSTGVWRITRITSFTPDGRPIACTTVDEGTNRAQHRQHERGVDQRLHRHNEPSPHPDRQDQHRHHPQRHQHSAAEHASATDVSTRPQRTWAESGRRTTGASSSGSALSADGLNGPRGKDSEDCGGRDSSGSGTSESRGLDDGCDDDRESSFSSLWQDYEEGAGGLLVVPGGRLGAGLLDDWREQAGYKGSNTAHGQQLSAAEQSDELRLTDERDIYPTPRQLGEGRSSLLELSPLRHRMAWTDDDDILPSLARQILHVVNDGETPTQREDDESVSAARVFADYHAGGARGGAKPMDAHDTATNITAHAAPVWDDPGSVEAYVREEVMGRSREPRDVGACMRRSAGEEELCEPVDVQSDIGSVIAPQPSAPAALQQHQQQQPSRAGGVLLSPAPHAEHDPEVLGLSTPDLFRLAHSSIWAPSPVHASHDDQHHHHPQQQPPQPAFPDYGHVQPQANLGTPECPPMTIQGAPDSAPLPSCQASIAHHALQDGQAPNPSTERVTGAERCAEGEREGSGSGDTAPGLLEVLPGRNGEGVQVAHEYVDEAHDVVRDWLPQSCAATDAGYTPLGARLNASDAKKCSQLRLQRFPIREAGGWIKKNKLSRRMQGFWRAQMLEAERRVAGGLEALQEELDAANAKANFLFKHDCCASHHTTNTTTNTLTATAPFQSPYTPFSATPVGTSAYSAPTPHRRARKPKLTFHQSSTPLSHSWGPVSSLPAGYVPVSGTAAPCFIDGGHGRRWVGEGCGWVGGAHMPDMAQCAEEGEGHRNQQPQQILLSQQQQQHDGAHSDAPQRVEHHNGHHVHFAASLHERQHQLHRQHQHEATRSARGLSENVRARRSKAGERGTAMRAAHKVGGSIPDSAAERSGDGVGDGGGGEGKEGTAAADGGAQLEPTRVGAKQSSASDSDTPARQPPQTSSSSSSSSAATLDQPTQDIHHGHHHARAPTSLWSVLGGGVLDAGVEVGVPVLIVPLLPEWMSLPKTHGKGSEAFLLKHKRTCVHFRVSKSLLSATPEVEVKTTSSANRNTTTTSSSNAKKKRTEQQKRKATAATQRDPQDLVFHIGMSSTEDIFFSFLASVDRVTWEGIQTRYDLLVSFHDAPLFLSSLLEQSTHTESFAHSASGDTHAHNTQTAPPSPRVPPPPPPPPCFDSSSSNTPSSTTQPRTHRPLPLPHAAPHACTACAVASNGCMLSESDAPVSRQERWDHMSHATVFMQTSETTGDLSFVRVLKGSPPSQVLCLPLCKTSDGVIKEHAAAWYRAVR